MSMFSEPVSRTAGIALHRQLYLRLREEIVRGVPAHGEALPNEERLRARFGVSRVTVRRAVADLEAQGFVRRRHGVGTFVEFDRGATRPSVTLSFVEQLRRTDTDTDVRVVSLARTVPPADVAANLQLPAGERALHAVRLRSAHGVPLLVTDVWVPLALGEGVTVGALRRRALYELLIERGVRFGRLVQEITVELASAEHARLLAVEVGAPLIRLTRLLHDRRDRPIQVLCASMSPERSRIVLDVPGSLINTLGGGRIVHDVIEAAGQAVPRRDCRDRKAAP